MTRQALDDRIVTYSDTVVAFALVNGIAFLISLGEPDIRCSIANVSGVAFALNLIVPMTGSYALFWLRAYQRALRAEAEGDEAEPDELVARFWRVAFRVRLGLIWLFAAIVIVGVFAATRDARCVLGVS
jgi:hypothetical protein